MRATDFSLPTGLVLLVVLACRADAQVPPIGHWRTIESEHFRVTYAEGLDVLAEHATRRAEAAHEQLVASLARAPAGKVDVVLTDNVDVTNGFATPFPSNRIVIYARPPVGVQGLEFHRDWIDLVVTHELAHIFHLDRAGRVGRAMRTVFGRLPMSWPPFPAAGTPGWSIEGLATHVESDLTGAGRVHGSYHEMVVRTAVLEDRFDPFDRVAASSPIWPGNERIYIYGSLFFDYLADRYGEDVRRRIIDRTASAVIPPALWFDRVGRRTLGIGFSRAYEDWRASLVQRYGRLADSLRATGLTIGERITEHGRYALHPRVSPDGARLAYAAQDARGITRTRVVDLATGRVLHQTRRNGFGPVAWLPDGDAFVLSQLEYDGPYHVLRDLYRVGDRAETPLTDGARLEDPDVDSSGQRVVAVENGGGTNRLVIVDRAGRTIRLLADFDPDVNWALPRWSPDGAHIAAGRWDAGGEYDVVVIDTLGDLVTRLARDRAVDTAPAWSPDGRYIIFSSDRTGIANLYAADLEDEAPSVRQVTNVLTGAFFPDVSPDGRWLYYSEYRADGYHIARLPFDPETWRDLPPLRPQLASSADSPSAEAPRSGAIARKSPLPPRAGGEGQGEGGRSALASRVARDDRSGDGGSPAGERRSDVEITAAREYSAWRSVLPTFWMPIGYRGGLGELYVGAASSGRDLLGRHQWSGSVTVAPASGRFEGGFGYTFAGLGNPVLSLNVSRDWDRTFGVLVDSVPRAAVASEDVVSLTASLIRPRWRSSATLTAGVEGVFVRREVVDRAAAPVRHPDERDDMVGVVAGASYASFVTPAYAISREDGISASVAGRARHETDPLDGNGRGYREASARTALYKALPLPGFANHVAAVRLSGITRRGGGAEPTDIGGTSGGPLSVFGLTMAGGSRLLPVRGFADGERAGTTAWTASFEYRLPIALIGRRPRLSPLFIDRISGALFADAGDAWCTGAAATRYRVCQPDQGGATSPRSPLLSAGAELVIDAALGSFAGGRLRFGTAVPLRPARSPALYLQFGSAF